MSITLKRAFLCLVLLAACAVPLRAASVTVAWDPNTEPDIVGYKVSWGTQPGVYAWSHTVGAVTSATVSNLTPGLTFYFAVQAMGSNNVLSPYSAEVSSHVPGGARVVGDFSGDRRADLTVFRQSSGTWRILQSTDNYQGGSTTEIAWGTSTDVSVPADYDGDGKADLAVWRPGDGNWFVLLSSFNYAVSNYFRVQWGAGALNDVPMPADFDGDGKADIAIWRPGDGSWFVLLSSFNYAVSNYFRVQWGAGALNDVPVPADFDGDGKADIAIWRPGDGSWFVLLSSFNYAVSNYFRVQWGSGALGDKPVPADYDGDGKADIAVWRPGEGNWWVLPSSSSYGLSGCFRVQWGLGALGDKPVPADYDGDGKADIAVWRPGDGNWFVLPSSNSYAVASYFRVTWGLAAVSDVPVVGR